MLLIERDDKVFTTSYPFNHSLSKHQRQDMKYLFFFPQLLPVNVNDDEIKESKQDMVWLIECN